MVGAAAVLVALATSLEIELRSELWAFTMLVTALPAAVLVAEAEPVI
jgi:hypothetical protein